MESSKDLNKFIDQRVRLNGTAENALAGAVVITASGMPVYIRGQEEWNSRVLGKPVVVEGTLRKGDVAPPAERVEGGMTPGISGDQFYIEMESYRLG